MITRGTTGIAFHTAAQIGRLGARVYITGRDHVLGRRAVDELRRLAGHDEVHLLVADTSSVEQNIALAEQLESRIDRLDVLIDNGGAAYADRTQTDEGYETTLAQNFVGPVAVTQHLLRLLGRSKAARIINVVSGTFQLWKGDPFEDLQATDRYLGIEAFARAELLTILFTLALARDLCEAGIAVNAVNPGMAWNPAAAAGTVVFFGTSPQATISGRYFENREEMQLPEPLLDAAAQQRAWEIGELLVERAGIQTGCGFLKGPSRMSAVRTDSPNPVFFV